MTNRTKINWSDLIYYNEANSNLVPENIGVYEIWNKYSDGNYYRDYVGMSENLNNRFMEHLGEEELNENIRNGLNTETAFRHTTTHSVNYAKHLEKSLYFMYEYSWNQVEPPGSDVRIDEEFYE